MLQRFRMTVDDCIEEYKTLGGEVFGRPRPPVVNKLRPKFDEKILEKAIKDVCERRGEHVGWNELGYSFENNTDNDMSKWFVETQAPSQTATDGLVTTASSLHSQIKTPQLGSTPSEHIQPPMLR